MSVESTNLTGCTRAATAAPTKLVQAPKTRWSDIGGLDAARDKLKSQGARVLGDGEPKIGAHDKPVLFLHPKDFTGCLIELEQE